MFLRLIVDMSGGENSGDESMKTLDAHSLKSKSLGTFEVVYVGRLAK